MKKTQQDVHIKEFYPTAPSGYVGRPSKHCSRPAADVKGNWKCKVSTCEDGVSATMKK
jgi:hypothetical protein